MRSVVLDPVAVGAQELQVLDVVLIAATGDDVVNLQDAERELTTAHVAPVLLLAEKNVLVLATRHRRVDFGAPGDVGTGCHRPIGTGRPSTAAGAC